jgi:glycosyltransferase involved in cell wall biosynthesis
MGCFDVSSLAGRTISMSVKVMIVVNSAWNLLNFRSGLIRALIAAGYEVIAVAPPDDYVSRVSELGCSFVPLPIDSKGTNPGRDLLLLLRFFLLLRKEKPNIYLGFTAKPNIYGSLAAHILGIPVINNIAGLGIVFKRENWLARLVKKLYWLALSRSKKVFFQNSEDEMLFIKYRLVNGQVAERLPGSGINLTQFVSLPLPNDSPIRFLLIARMLWDKGVGDFVEAARMLRKCGVRDEFCLLGFLDVKNPGAISRDQIREWVDEGIIQYLGVSDNVSEEIAKADCVVLPSYYREGTPRSLLEGAAMARPIVTTDSVGCRDVVEHGVTGYLCQPKNRDDLAGAMKAILLMSKCDREAMGLRGREKIERQYDEKIVINKYLDAILFSLKK